MIFYKKNVIIIIQGKERKNNQKTFEKKVKKVVDKQKALWYNKNVKREGAWTEQKPMAPKGRTETVPRPVSEKLQIFLKTS